MKNLIRAIAFVVALTSVTYAQAPTPVPWGLVAHGIASWEQSDPTGSGATISGLNMVGSDVIYVGVRSTLVVSEPTVTDSNGNAYVVDRVLTEASVVGVDQHVTRLSVFRVENPITTTGMWFRGGVDANHSCFCIIAVIGMRGSAHMVPESIAMNADPTDTRDFHPGALTPHLDGDLCVTFTAYADQNIQWVGLTGVPFSAILDSYSTQNNSGTGLGSGYAVCNAAVVDPVWHTYNPAYPVPGGSDPIGTHMVFAGSASTAPSGTPPPPSPPPPLSPTDPLVVLQAAVGALQHEFAELQAGFVTLQTTVAGLVGGTPPPSPPPPGVPPAAGTTPLTDAQGHVFTLAFVGNETVMTVFVDGTETYEKSSAQVLKNGIVYEHGIFRNGQASVWNGVSNFKNFHNATSWPVQ